MIRYSKYNILSSIKDSQQFFLLNLLTGNADILDRDEADRINILKNHSVEVKDEFTGELLSKGYFSDPEEEKKLFTNKYLEFLDTRENDEIQLFFVTNYSCNFSCNYCYQDAYTNPSGDPGIEVIDAFFEHIKKEFPARKKYITVFGGEPLLPGHEQQKKIRHLINLSNSAKLDLCFVTNGYTLSSYIDIIKTGRIREVQVTLDGTSEIHNKRRHLKGGSDTFQQITRGIDDCLANGIPVNLRMVLDKENIDNLPDLARFAIDKGWTDNQLFKTQLGRNYELHHCQSLPENLFDRINMYEKISGLLKVHPHILRFHKPAFSVSRFLSENGTLPSPLFDSCPACKTEWAFDYTGRIYSCTATVGKTEESLGSFYPKTEFFTNSIEQWQNRDVTTITECRDCNLQLACGGGCGSVSKNKTGMICSPDCRPVNELLELGFSHYF